MPTTKVTPEETSRALLAAIELMNKGGKHWTRGKFRFKDPYTGETSYCSVGAIQEIAKGNRPLRKAMYRALNEAIGKRNANERTSSIMSWNDGYKDLGNWIPKDWTDIRSGFKKAARIALRETTR